MIGEKLAHFTVVGKLGAGGMGEVWRATDSKLGRDVALKMLPGVFARDPERMARFQREAQVLASLNHPHIGAIYGLEDLSQSRFLVLELVEGPTLADRMQEGPVPLEEALSIAHQIADAVEAAHEKGIVHRDLKPANVKLTGDGRVKVLDFGLAKALEDPAVAASGSASAEGTPTMSPTLSPSITGAMTAANVILGTAAYMAPEQARGQVVDRRADIWAFGVILFEMLTGQRLFTGETISDTLASVLKSDPPWDALPEETPPRVRRMLRRCLERKPRERLRDIGDARLALSEVMSGVAEEEEPSLVGVAAPDLGPDAAVARRPSAPLLVAVAALAAVIGAAAMWALAPDPPAPPLRKFELTFPLGTALGSCALAPDGSALAFVRDEVLHVHEFTSLETRAFEDARDANCLFWSPDGEQIGFGTEQGLFRVRRTGGEPTRIAALSGSRAISSVGAAVWREDDRIFFTSGSSGLLHVSAQGGEPVELAMPDGENESDFHELADVGGEAWAVAVHRGANFGTIALIEEDGTRHDLISHPEDIYDLAWAPSGHLLYRRTGDSAGLWALPLEPGRGEPSGDAFLVSADARRVSVAGNMVTWTTGVSTRETVLAIVDRKGNTLQEIGTPARYYGYPSLSPDERQIACRVTEGETLNQWIVDIDRGSRGRLTTGEGPHEYGTWDATGEQFYYYDEVFSDSAAVWVRPASGAGEARVVTQGWVPEPSEDGRWLFVTRPKGGSFEFDLYLLDLQTDGAEATEFLATDAFEFRGAPSPTDPLVAYSSDASGNDEVYLTTYPEKRGNWLVSTSGGFWTRWRADGLELYYSVADSIMAVDVDPDGPGGAPRLSRPELLFRRPGGARGGRFPHGFDVFADGARFVIHVPVEQNEEVTPSLVVVQNWLAEFE